VQGIAVAERAYQLAVAYAKERVQSRPVDGSAKQSVTIIHHPDVRRMLATMRALTEGARALAYVAAAHSDIAHHATDADTRAQHTAIYEFLVPVVKGWSTELSIDVASLGVQVHGGMGFIEETGAAQHYRDARILTIYEGTTAIQANDLVGRRGRAGAARTDRSDDCGADTPRRRAVRRDASSSGRGTRGARQRRRVCAGEHEARSERGVRGQRAVSEARGHRAHGLADGACAAGGKREAQRG
jgi:hypothetical protein